MSKELFSHPTDSMNRFLLRPIINYQTISSMLRRLFARNRMPKHTNYEVPRTSKCPQQRVSPQRALQTATSDAALPAVCPFAHIYVLFREKSARRQGHPCLWFVRDFSSAVNPSFRSFVTFISASFLIRSCTCSSVTFASERLQQRQSSPSARPSVLAVRS